VSLVRDNVLATHFSQDGEFRYEVIDMKNGTLRVWVQKKIYDDYMGNDWFDWCDISDHAHITDTIERAVEIGNEAITNLAGA